MNERRTNKEREALLAGDRAGALEPEEAAELALLADVLADPSLWTEPSAALEDAVVDAVINAEPAPTATPRPAPTVVSIERPRHWRRFALSAGGIAATIAIVFGAVIATEGGTSVDFSGRLSATALAPGSSASADITHNAAGFRVTLDAHGLPVLPTGQYYQAWLKNATGTLVPIGTFSSSDGRITLWSGVSPKDFPTLTVTIEATDNNQASSGRRVLAGEVHSG
jgi:Anti-sigma-K factor rskA, C-terminal